MNISELFQYFNKSLVFFFKSSYYTCTNFSLSVFLLLMCSIPRMCRRSSTLTRRRKESWVSGAATSSKSWTTPTPTGGKEAATAKRACSPATTSRLSIGTCKQSDHVYNNNNNSHHHNSSHHHHRRHYRSWSHQPPSNPRNHPSTSLRHPTITGADRKNANNRERESEWERERERGKAGVVLS